MSELLQGVQFFERDSPEQHIRKMRVFQEEVIKLARLIDETSTSSGSGATAESYLVYSPSATLTNELQLTAAGGPTLAADGLGNYVLSILQNALGLDRLAQIAGPSLLGRASNSTGDVGVISSSADGQFMRRAAGALGFGAITNADLPVSLDGNARIAVSKNSGATVGTRRRLNLIEGTNITLTIADDAGNEEVDATIAASISNITGNLQLSGDISPSQITADQNNYNPTGLATASTLRLSTDASRTLTGLTAGGDGELKLVRNVGGFDLVLSNENASSTAANRFKIGTDYTISASHGAVLQYDTTDSRWYIVGEYSVPGGGGGAPTTASYVVIALDAGLSAERRLQVEAAVLSLTDGGANADVTIGVAANGITDAKLRQGGATSVVGRSANSVGNLADIAASADGQFLRRASAALGFGAIVSADLPATGDINARVAVNKNSGATVGTRRRINFIEGSNVTVTVADDGGNEEVDVTLAAASGAPVGSQYVVVALDATLTSERRLQAEGGVLSLTDGGADADITLSVAANGIGDAKLRQGAATSVIGRSANTLGNVADIAASADGQFLRRSGGALGFGAIVSGDLPATGDINARVAVNKNSGATVGTRRRINLIEGSNVTLTIADDGVNEEVDVTIAAATAAPVGASYVVIALDGTLTSERRLQAEASVLSLTDGGVNADVTIGVAANGITDAKLRQGAATSVIGRSANTLGNVADIAASADGQFLRRASAALGFGAIVSGDLPATGDINARVAVNKNSGATVGTRRRHNFIEGANITLTIADDAGNEEVDITIAAAAGGAQAALQFQDEGANLGAAGTVDTVDFVGAGVTAARAANKVTVTIAGGAGSFAITEVEVDFGTTPVRDANFTVTDAAIAATSKIMIQESGKAAAGRIAGDSQWDSIACTALPGTGNFVVYCLANPGPVVGKRKLQYTVN